MRKLGLFLVILMLSTTLIGCGSEEKEAESGKAQQLEEQARRDAEAKANKEAEEQAQKEAEEEARKEAEQNAKADLDEYLESFRLMEVSWIQSVEEVEVKLGENNVVQVKTTLYPDEEGKQFAEPIVSGIWGWTNSNENNLKIHYVVILDQNGDRLLSKKNPI